MSHRIRDYPGGRCEVDIRFRLPNGDWFRKRVLAPSGTKAQTRLWAEKYERDLVDEVLRSQGTADRRTMPTFTQFSTRFIDEYARANKHKPSGIASKESVLKLHILPRFGSMRLDEITSADVQRLKADLTEKSAKTVNNVLSVLSKMLRVATEWGALTTMPVRISLIRAQDKEMTFHEPEVYARLLTAAAHMSPVDELLVRLGGDAGLRRGELLGLRGEHVDLRRNTITVSSNIVRDEDVATKGLKVRRVPMTSGLADLLRQHFAETRGHLLGEEGGPTTAKTLRVQMAKIERAAGIEAYGRLHVLRHTFCSHLAMAGVPVLEIQRPAGHANLATTIKYMHLAPGTDLNRAIGLLDKLRSGFKGDDGAPRSP